MDQDDRAVAVKVVSLPVPPGDELVSRDEFLRVIGVPRHRAAATLHVLLGRCNPGAPVPDQLLAIEQLGR